MRREKITAGYIYILTNEFMPGLVKIGKTTRKPEHRVNEISATTGVPTKFEVAYQFRVSNCHEAEKEIHHKLSDVRVNNAREFFHLELKAAMTVVSKICDKYPVNETVTPSIFNKPRIFLARLYFYIGYIGLFLVCIACWQCASSFKLIYNPITSNQPVEPFIIPTSSSPAPTLLYREVENPPKERQIVWVYELKNLSKDMTPWDIWKQTVEPQVKGYMTWNEFKEEVLLHNPHLDKEKPVFHPNEVYVLPQLK